jgi:hypothetical protein
MSNEPTQPPQLAVFLLRHLHPKDNREVLIGDLVESFREGRSERWFWGQVLVALTVGISRALPLLWPEISFAFAGTLVIQLESWIMRMPLIERLWAQGISLRSPLPTIYDFGFQAALGAIMLQPLLAVVLLLARRFSWYSVLRTFSICFLLLMASDVVVILWGMNSHVSAYRPPPATLRDFVMRVLHSQHPFLMLIPFFALLISALVGWSRPVQLRQGVEGGEP